MKYTAKPTASKKTLVSSLSDELKNTKAVAVMDYTGLKVSQSTELRRSIKKAGGKVIVTKNTLFKIASGLSDLKVSGLSAYILSQKDEVSAIKAAADFSKKNSILKFTAGILGNRVLTAQEVTDLAAIPPKEVLISKLLGSIKSPLYGLANALNWNISKLVRTLDAVRASKS